MSNFIECLHSKLDYLTVSFSENRIKNFKFAIYCEVSNPNEQAADQSQTRSEE